MKLLVVIALYLFPVLLFAQNTTMYVALKSGLSIRDKPGEAGKVIGKIPYGTKVSIGTGTTTDTRIITEGFYGYWVKVTYGQLTGYIVDSYLLPIAPPAATVKSMKEYLLQLSPAFGAQLVVKKGVIQFNNSGSLLKKQLYRNGASYHEFEAYEYSGASCFLPDLTTKQAFLLIRLIPEYVNAFTATDPFPAANKKYKRNDIEYDLTVEKEQLGDEPYIKKIHLEFSDGSFTTLEIMDIEGEAVITFSSGV